MCLRFDGVNPGLEHLAKSESGLEDVPRSIVIDFGAILVSILDPKIVKNQAKNRVKFGNAFRRDV